jgi:hypothetical protein
VFQNTDGDVSSETSCAGGLTTLNWIALWRKFQLNPNEEQVQSNKMTGHFNYFAFLCKATKNINHF